MRSSNTSVMRTINTGTRAASPVRQASRRSVMRVALVSVLALCTTIGLPTLAGAQPAAPPNPPAELLNAPNFLPIGPPANVARSAVPDLSGDWAFDNRPGRQTPFQSLSAADPQGAKRGKE